MRIILESTSSDPKFSVKTSIEVPHDDLVLDDVIEELVKPVLLGYGFHPKCIDKYFDQDNYD